MEKFIFCLLLSIFLLSSCTTNDNITEILNINSFYGSVLIAEGDNILFAESYGFANQEKKILNTSNTKFQIGSITKQFTATAIMMLEEDGLLNTLDPVNKYLDYPVGDSVTIDSLLTHTSGIPEYTSGHFFTSTDLNREYSPEEIIDFIPVKDNLIEVKKRKYEYCNSNYILLGFIIEKVSGLSYGNFLQERIFLPLDMNQSGIEGNYLMQENIALGYEGVSVVSNRSFDMNLSIAYAAGGIYSTVNDLLKWHKALSTDLLSEESKNKMYSLWNRKSTGYGYGWDIDKKNDVVSHYGGIPGFSSCIYRTLNNNQIIIILSNTNDLKKVDKIKKRSIQILNKF